MKRKLMTAIVAMLLALATAASAASGLSILRITVSGARVRSGPGNYEILSSLKKGTKVFYKGENKKAYYKVYSETGNSGWVFRDHLEPYLKLDKKYVYATDGSCALYKSADVKSKKLRKFSTSTLVVAQSLDGIWAEVRTLSGQHGYMLLGDLDQ